MNETEDEETAETTAEAQGGDRPGGRTPVCDTESKND